MRKYGQGEAVRPPGDDQDRRRDGSGDDRTRSSSAGPTSWRPARATATATAVVLVCALGLAGGGAATHSRLAVSTATTRVEPGGPAVDRAFPSSPDPAFAAARRDARRLLRLVRLPAGAVRVAALPPRPGEELGRPLSTPDSPNLVDDVAYYVLSGSPRSTLRFVAEHPPRGSVPDGSGSATLANSSGPYAWMASFSFPARVGILASRSLLVASVADGALRTAVRVDAQVTWLPPKPSRERIPKGVRVLTIATGYGPTEQPDGTITAGPTTPVRAELVTGSRSVIAAVAAEIDRLVVEGPGVIVCPADSGISVWLGFSAREGSRPLARVVIDRTGCETAQLSAAGRSFPELSGGGAVIAVIESRLGIALARFGPLNR